MYAICQRTEGKLKQVGDAFNIAKRYTHYEDVLADPHVDVVHINTPIPDHAPQAIAALKAGKHVVCTVPMATTIDECRQIVELVKKTGLKYMMVETVVYAREFLFVKEMYEQGRAGQAAVSASQPSAGHGRLARLLARPAADALRHALRRPLPGADHGRGRIRLLLRLRDHPRGTDRQVQLAVRRRDARTSSCATPT